MMKREQTNSVVAFPAHIAPTVADEDTASVIAVLQEQLALARERHRSVYHAEIVVAGSALRSPGEQHLFIDGLIHNGPPGE